MPIVRSAMASLGRIVMLSLAAVAPRRKPPTVLFDGSRPVRVETHRNGAKVPVFRGYDRRIGLSLARDATRPAGRFNGHTKAWRRARQAEAR